MKNIFIYLCTLLCVFAIVSCNDDDKTGAGYDPNKPVVVASFYPDSGRVAEKVILEGENFGSDPSKISVYFNNKKAAVVGSTGKLLYVVVPRLPGDTCTVSVKVGDSGNPVLGKDSVVFDQTFRYKISVSVKTIAGNGSQNYENGGTPAETTLQPAYIDVDKDNNVFVIFKGWGVVRINEEENTVETIVAPLSISGFSPSVPGIDKETGLVSIPSDAAREIFYTFDPKDAWAPKMRRFRYKDGTIDLPYNTWKKAIAVSPLDGSLYYHHYNGHIFKANPVTYEAELIGHLPTCAAYGLAFHPLRPNLLYFSFDNYGGGPYQNSICCMDVTDSIPLNTFMKLSGPTAGGFRDGELAVAQFDRPRQIQFDKDGNLYVADNGNHCIRRISPDNIVETVLGIPGSAGRENGGKEDARFNQPWGLCVREDGNIYVGDYGNSLLRKLTIE
jgi:streptogramin lyase